MKRSTAFALIAAVLAITGFRLFASRAAPVPEAFAGGLTLGAAIERADSRSLPVVALATADWCGPCQAFKRGALRDPRVEAWIRNHAVACYVDVDRARADAAILGVRSIPAIVLLRAGTPTARLEGNRGADELLAWLGRASADGAPAPR